MIMLYEHDIIVSSHHCTRRFGRRQQVADDQHRKHRYSVAYVASKSKSRY